MPHVDDGQLHALLDGAFDDREARPLLAHLETCAHCAARLEQERALRDRSAAILAAAQPVRMATPPFDDVIHKARQSPARHTFWPVPGRLAWAATIVVALGVGWFSNDLTRFDRAASSIPGEEGIAPPPAPSTTPAAPSAVAEPSAAAPDNARTRQERALQSGAEMRSMDRRVALDSIGSKARETLARDDLAKKEKPAEALRADAVRLNELVVTGVTTAPRVDSAVRSIVSDPRGQVGQAGAGRGAPPAPSQQALQQGQFLQNAKAVTLERWENLTAEQAEARSGQKVLLVPELEVLNISMALAGNTYQIRVVQRLPGGEILDLLQHPATAQQTSLGAAAGSAVRQVESERNRQNRDEAQIIDGKLVVQRDRVMLTGRAPLTQDSLRALLLRAR